MELKRYIHVTKEDREFLSKKYNVTVKTVFNALTIDNTRGNSEICNLIRKDALMRGGIMMVETPQMETFHDHDGYMRQVLPNGALIELSKIDGHGTVFHRGRKIKDYTDVMVDEIPAIQEFAASL